MKREKMAIMTLVASVLVMAWALPVLADNLETININTASLEELMTLGGVGEKYAERIIKFREKNGPFQMPEDIIQVKGIGEKIYNTNADKIVVKD